MSQPSFAAGTNCPVALFQPLRSLQEGLQGVLGGRFMCSSMTVDDVNTYAVNCPSRPSNPVTTSDNLGGLAVGMFYQSLAANSHRQANCRVGLLDDYRTNAGHRATLNAAVKAAYESVRPQLADLLKQRQAKLDFITTFDDPRYMDKAMFGVAAEGRETTKKEIAAVDESMAKLLLKVPMGYDTDVARSLIEMGTSGAFNERAFAAAMAQAKDKYVTTSKYYDDKFTPDPVKKNTGSYCLGLDYKNLAGASGETKHWLKALPAKTAKERELNEKLSCRLGATYERGRYITDKTFAIASWATLIIPGGAEVESLVAVSRAASFIRSAAAVGTVMSIDQLRQQCLPPDAFTSGDGGACDAEKDFQRTLTEPSKLACVEIVGSVGGVGVMAAKKVLAIKNARVLKTGD